MQRASRLKYLLAVAVLAAGCGSQPSGRESEVQSSVARGYVLPPDDAETLVGGNGVVTIIASPSTGSEIFAMGTQKLYPNSSIPVHRHEHADEAFFVHQGGGVGIVGDRHTVLSPGDAVYVPRGVWHGFETGTEELNVVWFIAPPGLEQFFRETRVEPGTPLRNLTPEQMEQIGLRHGIRNR
ncbi:MAG TPA: cupin domain-containing protein [Acidobacteriota bacterium]